MGLSAGMRFGPYEITGELGEGGMGEVYRATDTGLKRDVAIKVLPESFASDADRLARFQREAEVLAALNHPNIAQIYGLEKADDRTVIVMELVEGPTLADRIADGPVPPDEALLIARQIADALEAAHVRQIVHRDLKPANIKLRPDGTIKVLDFGIATAPDSGQATSGGRTPTLLTPAMTEAGWLLGTAAYMSPEQARGRAVDQRADIWAFGCVLYEMLTGQPAFGGEDVTTTLARVLEREANTTALPANLSASVRHTLGLCLEKDPGKRIADIRDVRLALDGAFEPAAADIGDKAQAPAVPRWRRVLTPAAAFVVGGMLIGIAVWWLTTPPPAPVNRFAYVPPADQPVANSAFNLIAVSPDGRRFAYTSQGRLFLRELDQLETRLIAEGDDLGNALALVQPIFSPDGQSVAWMEAESGNMVLRRVGITGGAPVLVARWSGRFPVGMRWVEDGRILIAFLQNQESGPISAGGEELGIFSVPATGGSPERIASPGENETFSGVELLPDGDTLVVSVIDRPPVIGLSWDDARVVAHSISTGERTVLVDGGWGARYVPSGHLVYQYEDGLFAVAFDARTLTVTGGAVPIVQNLVTQTGRVPTPSFGVARNGSLIYVENVAGRAVESMPAGGLNSLVWVDRDGREQDIGVEAGGYVYPRLSPAGDRIALDDRNDNNRTGEIWVWDVERETRTRLTIGEQGGVYPVWTADGREIVYSNFATGEIERRAADNSGQPETLLARIDPIASSDAPLPYFFSPSGRELVFRDQTNPDTRNNIAMISLDDDNAFTWLLNEPYNEMNADLSPDGRWMAYQSDESGELEIYVRPFPNVDDARVQISNGGGRYPRFARDGTELYYLLSGRPSRMMAVTVDAGDGDFAFADRRALFDWPYIGAEGVGMIQNPPGRTYDVAADGRFLALRPAIDGGIDGSPLRIIVVENWVSELERLVPTN